ncbi:MAG: SDR family oxidoreductase [Myxococcota bacterium]
MSNTKVIVVMGAGDALGGAIARRFAREGYTTVICRRNGDKLEPLAEQIRALGGQVHPRGVDGRQEDQVQELFRWCEAEVGPVTVAVHNIGANVYFPILDTTARVYRKVWELAAFSAFLFGREAARVMVPRKQGTILFTGATGSLRGASGFSAFAGGMHAKRALAQSMARELMPHNLHVAHVVIDGPIDTAFTRENFPKLYETRPPDGVLLPDQIAETYWMLHQQGRSAWTHELDVRPWVEPW